MEATNADSHPRVLPGPGAGDFERYLRTDELLALQKESEERVHGDELLFQTVHPSSELWLKLAVAEMVEATERVREDELGAALRLLRRANQCLTVITTQLELLEHISPWECHEVRKVLGDGSGFDSPGCRGIRDLTSGLGVAFRERLGQAGLRPRPFETCATAPRSRTSRLAAGRSAPRRVSGPGTRSASR
jgi:tryptophan 2,3-dioxygenase